MWTSPSYLLCRTVSISLFTNQCPNTSQSKILIFMHAALRETLKLSTLKALAGCSGFHYHLWPCTIECLIAPLPFFYLRQTKLLVLTQDRIQLMSWRKWGTCLSQNHLRGSPENLIYNFLLSKINMYIAYWIKYAESSIGEGFSQTNASEHHINLVTGE